MNANTSYWNTEESERKILEEDREWLLSEYTPVAPLYSEFEYTPVASAYSELDFQTMDQLRRLLALPQVEDLAFDLDELLWAECEPTALGYLQ